jgi:hypothetical protein
VRKVSSTNGVVTAGYPLQKNEARLLLCTKYKNELKTYQKLKYKSKDIKLLEKNIGANINELVFGDGTKSTNRRNR